MQSLVPKHFKLIDILRGVCAIAVVVFHYQHFYYTDPYHVMGDGARVTQPYYHSLALLYEYGFSAVNMFWLISGFVFYHVYGSRNRPNAKSYAANRFSRLYPLHFITLLLVMALQVANLEVVGHFQIYKNTDIPHFLLNLLFISGWSKAWESFNGPVWSVSVELIVYAGFFAFMCLRRWRVPIAALVFVVAMVGFLVTKNAIVQCFSDFFAGVLIYVGTVWLSKKNAILNIILSGATTAALLAMVITLAYLPRWSHYDLEFTRLFLFSAVLWLLGSIEIGMGAGALKKVHWVGDITYSSYLIHVPLQLAILLVLDGIVKSRAIVSTGPFFLEYMLAIVLLSYLTYVFVERPIQTYLRSRLA